MKNYRPGLADVDPPERTAPHFDAEAYPVGVNVAVDVPADVSAWFADEGYVPVFGLLRGTGIRGTLVPVGEGRHRLFLNGEMRRATGVAVGSSCSLLLWRDDVPREPALPDDVRSALTENGALEAFLSLPPSHQREYLVVIEDAKRPETRRRRIQRTISEIGN